MTQLDDSVYLILTGTRKKYGPTKNGLREVESFSVQRIRRGLPHTNVDEVAVRLKISLDSSLFDQIIPEVDVEIGASDVLVNPRVEVDVEEPDTAD